MSEWRRKLREVRKDLERDEREPTRLATDDEREHVRALQPQPQGPADWTVEPASDAMLAAGLLRKAAEGRLVERVPE